MLHLYVTYVMYMLYCYIIICYIYIICYIFFLFSKASSFMFLEKQNFYTNNTFFCIWDTIIPFLPSPEKYKIIEHTTHFLNKGGV